MSIAHLIDQRKKVFGKKLVNRKAVC